jgi:uncharacterized protein YjeT (DUF2065 family)
MAEMLPQVPENQLRASGLFAIGLGVLMVWFIRGA